MRFEGQIKKQEQAKLLGKKNAQMTQRNAKETKLKTQEEEINPKILAKEGRLKRTQAKQNQPK